MNGDRGDNGTNEDNNGDNWIFLNATKSINC